MRICLDASTVVKWFKEGEEFEEEALELYDKIEKMEIDVVANEWILLEVVRALVKANCSKDKVDNDFKTLEDLFDIDAIKRISVTSTLSLAKNLEYELKLYAADAVHLATAILSGSSVLLSEDEHLNKRKVKEYARNLNLKIKKLSEFF